MLYNIDMLTLTLHDRLKARNCQVVAEYLGPAEVNQTTPNFQFEPCDIGDLVIAPLNLSRYKSIESRNLSTTSMINGEVCIWARAEVLKLSNVSYQKMVCFIKMILLFAY